MHILNVAYRINVRLKNGVIRYYKKTFHTRDCIPLTGTCWVVGFSIAIWPFHTSARWQCHVYHALTSPVVIPLQKTLWANIDLSWGFVKRIHSFLEKLTKDANFLGRTHFCTTNLRIW